MDGAARRTVILLSEEKSKKQGDFILRSEVIFGSADAALLFSSKSKESASEDGL